MTPVQSMGDMAVDSGRYEAIEHHVTETQYKQHHKGHKSLCDTSALLQNLVSCKLKADYSDLSQPKEPQNYIYCLNI